MRRLAALATGLVLLAALPALAHPGVGIAVDGAGRILVADGPRHRILRIPAGAGEGAAETIIQGGLDEDFRVPHHLVRAPDGLLHTASDSGRYVARLDEDGRLHPVLPENASPHAPTIGAGGDPFAVDAEGRLWAVHWGGSGFLQVVVRTPAGRIDAVYGGAIGHRDGRGTEARFRGLHGSEMVWTEDGRLLLTDGGTSVRVLAPGGVVTTLAGGATAGYRDGPGAAARFDGASGLALDGRRGVFVADTGNHRIRFLDARNLVTTVAGSGERGHDDGDALEATFDQPTGLAIAGDGALLILDHARDGTSLRVRRLDADGRVTTVAVVETPR